ncbi:hypothetical protein Hhel01_02762 [Haloferula helveola]
MEKGASCGLAFGGGQGGWMFGMGSARDHLREATSGAHARLDRHVVVESLVSGRMGRTEYSRLLRGYFGWFRHWETAMRETRAEVVEMLGPERFRRSEWLAEDLATLGHPSEPLIDEAPAPLDGAALAGQLYVIEGSTLGGAHLVRAGGGLPGGASRFYEGYRGNTGPMWKEFLDWLEPEIPSERERDEAAAAATRVFDSFGGMFDRVVDSACVEEAHRGSDPQ